MDGSAAVVQAMLDAIETTIGVSPTLEMRSGALPANCAAADAGSVLASMTLPSDWMAAAISAGTKAKSGTWQDASADAAGTLGHWRIKAGATCHLQGTITVGGGGGDMTVDNLTTAVGQPVIINTFTLNLAALL